MKGLFEYKKRFLINIFKFKKVFNEVFELVEQTKQQNISLIGLNRNIDIKVPANIDGITYKAMMELQAMSENDGDIQDYIATVVTKVCYSENYDEDYSTNNDNYTILREKILNSPLVDMMGVYNWTITSLRESNKHWKERFLSVQVTDADYSQADAGAMAQFNVIRTVKNLCKDFNVDYYQAWQLSYALTQTSAYDSATESHVQDKLRKLKEVKMRAQQKRGY